jgi:endo-1,4-beta-xylanase
MRTDHDAHLSIKGFLGDYVIRRKGRSAPVSLSRGRETATVRFR